MYGHYFSPVILMCHAMGADKSVSGELMFRAGAVGNWIASSE
jgi:hypothetical protein